MTIEEKLLQLIERQYKSVRSFSKIVDIPNSTLVSALKNGIGGMAVEKALKISKALNISAESLIYEREILSQVPVPPDLPTNSNSVPILGQVACGILTYADENIIGYIDAPTSKRVDFALIAKGDSMINARILDGDIVYIRKQSDVENGEIAVVVVDDEATLKRVYKSDGILILRAENPNYRDINLTKNDNPIILGKAIFFESEVR